MGKNTLDNKQIKDTPQPGKETQEERSRQADEATGVEPDPDLR
jgi:hypothetical protein